MNQKVQERLEQARKELLDLGLRNPLLNFKPRSRNLELVDGDSSHLFEALVRQDQKFSFEFKTQDPQKQPTFPALTDDASPESPTRKRNQLYVDLTAKELNKRLHTIQYHARSLLEEQGLTTLYLALGMLHWCEESKPNDLRKAPLVLVPVNLTRPSVYGKYYLQYNGEELGENLSLSLRLQTMEGLQPPVVDWDEEVFDIAAYFQSFRKSFQESRPTWKLEPNQVALGFFSFGKFLMCRDLDPQSWPDHSKPEQNPLIQALLGDGFHEAPAQYTEDTFLDDILAPGKLHPVMDMDSSQTLAVLDVKQGRNLVVQGPPGTGKSQTITNLIAEQLADGKKVLFVAEKMAALEVVKSRLDRIGLGEACLELHSHKTKKRLVLEELNRTLNLGRPIIDRTAHADQDLIASRDHLNQYARAINEPQQPAGVSVLEAYGRLLLHADHKQQPRVSFKPMADWNLEKFHQILQKVEDFDQLLKEGPHPLEHLFWGAKLKECTPATLPELGTILHNLQLVGKQLQYQLLEVGSLFQLQPPFKPLDSLPLLESIHLLLSTPDLRSYPLTSSAWKEMPQKRQALMASLQEWHDYREHYRYTIRDEAWSMALKETREIIAGYVDNPWRFFSGRYQKATAKLKSLFHQRRLPDSVSTLVKLAKSLEQGGSDDLTRSTLLPEAWSAAQQRAFQPLLDHGGKWFRFLVPSYRKAKKLMLSFCRHTPKPDDPTEWLDWIDAIEEGQQLRQQIKRFDELGRTLYGSNWRSADSSYLSLQQVTAWLEPVFEKINENKLPSTLPELLMKTPLRSRLEEQARELKKSHEEWSQHLEVVENFLKMRPVLSKGIPLDDLEFPKIDHTLQQWRDHSQHLYWLANYNRFCSDFYRIGLNDLAALSRSTDALKLSLPVILEISWYEGVLDQAYRNHPVLMRFDQAAHEQTLKRFVEQDLDWIEDNRAHLALLHWNSLPPREAGGQMSVLLREIEKKRRHLPIRQLLNKAGQVIQKIKPVFMMGPMSVATYLEPGALEFDLVVFDEASQVKPVDAFGALLRGKQAVVVGDSKQLPPTSFFDTLTQHDDPDEEDFITSDIESILGLFAGQGAPMRMLRWHYRSRHESLISVSNQLFYNRGLVLFPSPHAQANDRGLTHVHLPEAVYDRGRHRNNPVEAQNVARAVMNHFRNFPDLTLGVVALSVAQRNAIEEELESLRLKDPSLEQYFHAANDESFFIKNLENVQGDERDVMYISIGYGKDDKGQMSMNFGPINAKGGERRLNVLFTRARQACVVFSSFRGEEIRDENGNPGLAALKQFLIAVEHPQHSVSIQGQKTNAFQEFLSQKLAEHGWQTEVQVGQSGLYVDIAVRHPEEKNRYLTGLMIDGPNYHAAQSARDRDRLRTSVLQRLGWDLVSVWSTHWFQDSQAALQKAIKHLEQAKTAPSKATQVSLVSLEEPELMEPPLAPSWRVVEAPQVEVLPPKPPAQAEKAAKEKPPTATPVIEVEEMAEEPLAEAPQPSTAPKLTQSALVADKKGEAGMQVEAEKTAQETKPAEVAKPMNSASPPQPAPAVQRQADVKRESRYPVQPYQEASLKQLLAGKEGQDLDAELEDEAFKQVVQTEAPLHLKRLQKVFLEGLGLSRINKKLSAKLDLALARAESRGLVSVQGEFIHLQQGESGLLRDRSSQPAASRKVEWLPPAECELALLKVVDEAVAINLEQALSDAAEVLGYKRLTQPIRKYLSEILSTMLQDGKLKQKEDLLTR